MFLQSLGKLYLDNKELVGRDYWLLVYLGLEPKQHKRDHLATLFFNHTKDPKARLRRAIFRINKLNKQNKKNKEKLIIADRLYLRISNKLELDVIKLRKAFQKQDLDTAISLYNGPFLDADLKILSPKGKLIPTIDTTITAELQDWLEQIQTEVVDIMREVYLLKAEELLIENGLEAATLSFKAFTEFGIASNHKNQHSLEQQYARYKKLLENGPEKYLIRLTDEMAEQNIKLSITNTNLYKKGLQVIGEIPFSKIEYWQTRPELIQLKNLLMTNKQVEINALKGFGKTTLITKLISELDTETIYDWVIYIDLSNGLNIDDFYAYIQKLWPESDIGQLYGILEQKSTVDYKIKRIFEIMDYRLLLIIDSVELSLGKNKESKQYFSKIQELFFATQKYIDKVHMVIISQQKTNLPIKELIIKKGLSLESGMSLLKNLAPDQLRFDKTKVELLSEIVKICDGIPQNIESFISMMISNNKQLSKLTIKELKNFRKNGKKALFESLNRTIPLLEALAIYSVPVKLEALERILEPLNKGDLQKGIDNLSIKKNKDLYQLNSFVDQNLLLQEINNPKKYHLKAAQYFASQALELQQITSYHDLYPQRQEIEQLIKAEEYNQAAQVLSVIGIKFLHPWRYYSYLHKQCKILLKYPISLEMQAKLYNLLALGYRQQNKNKIALESFELALNLSRESSSLSEIDILINLATIYQTKDSTKAFSLLENALKLARSYSQDSVQTAAALGYLGMQHLIKNNPQLAITNLQLSFQILSLPHSDIHPVRILIALFTGLLGKAHHLANNRTQAKKYIIDAIKLHKINHSEVPEAANLDNLAQLYWPKEKEYAIILWLASYLLHKRHNSSFEKTLYQRIKSLSKDVDDFENFMFLASYSGDKLLYEATGIKYELFDKLSIETWLELKTKLKIENTSPPNSEKIISITPIAKPDPFFVGRNKELRNLQGIFDNATRVISITGMVGVGKTQLALAFIDKLQKNFVDGQFFIPLSYLNSSSLYGFLNYIARFLEIEIDINSPSQSFISKLANKELLLLLDGFEHAMSYKHILEDISKLCPKITIIVTSQEKLFIASEVNLNLSGLNYPEQDNYLDMLKFEQFPAVQLFLSLSKHYKHHISLSDRQHIQRIIATVNGSPLGIKLAAQPFTNHSVKHIADSLSKDLDIFKTNKTDLSSEYKDLNKVLDYTWSLLKPSERQYMLELSVFFGFSFEAARAITGISLSTLTNFVNKSLLEYNIQHERYYVHTLVLQYLRDKINSLKNIHELRQKHSSYYLTNIANPQISNKCNTACLKRELQNIIQAWQYATDNRDERLIITATNNLQQVFDKSSNYNQGLELFDKALAVFSEQASIKGHLLAAKSWLLLRLWRYPDAKTSATKAIKYLEHDNSENAKTAVSSCYNVLGAVSDISSDFETAKQYFQKNYNLHNPVSGDAANAQVNLALNALNRGQISEAKILIDSAEAIFIKHNRNSKLAWLSFVRGKLLCIMGKNTKALEILHQGLRQYSNQQASINLMKLQIARIYIRTKKYEKAKNKAYELLFSAAISKAKGIETSSHSILAQALIAEKNIEMSLPHLVFSLKQLIKSKATASILRELQHVIIVYQKFDKHKAIALIEFMKQNLHKMRAFEKPLSLPETKVENSLNWNNKTAIELATIIIADLDKLQSNFESDLSRGKNTPR